MEFTQIKIKTHPITVVFNGSQYVFYSEYCGIVAHAVRLEPFNSREKRFNLFTGSKACDGYLAHSTIFSGCAKFIRKNETKYIDANVVFENLCCDLSQKTLQLNVIDIR